MKFVITTFILSTTTLLIAWTIWYLTTNMGKKITFILLSFYMLGIVLRQTIGKNQPIYILFAFPLFLALLIKIILTAHENDKKLKEMEVTQNEDYNH